MGPKIAVLEIKVEAEELDFWRDAGASREGFANT